MKKLLIILLAWGMALSAYANETQLKGHVKGFRGKRVRLLTYADQISYKRILLAEDSVDNEGNFSLTATIPGTTYAFIEFNHQTGEIFLEPGLSYEITLFPEEDTDVMAYYDLPPLEVSILNETANQLNHLIQNVNLIYNNFLLDNPRLFQSPSRKVKVQGVIAHMDSVISSYDNNYLHQYLRYKVASLELFTRARSDKNLAGEYLTGNEVLYGNIEYMDFFHLFFEKYLLVNNPYLPYSRTSALINGDIPLKEILVEFSKDPVLEDSRLAELVLLSGLKEMSSNPGFKQERVLDLLDQVSNVSEFQEHRQIAVNLKERILWMKPGTPAPGFKLKDVLGGTRQLSDYKGKPVYLSFISLDSPSSLAEMNLLSDIFPDYSDRYHFVSVIMDEPQPGWTQVIKEYRMRWDLLLAGEDYYLRERYGVSALPLFILLDPDGNIFRYPAPSPSEDLKRVLDSF